MVMQRFERYHPAKKILRDICLLGTLVVCSFCQKLVKMHPNYSSKRDHA